MKQRSIVKLALEALDYEDENLRALRLAKQRALDAIAAREQEEKEAAEAMFQRNLYLYEDGTCKEHDRGYCSECRRYAAGRGHPDEWL